ncbi:MAG: calcium/sodium antiporter [Limisphaerales bacterium]
MMSILLSLVGGLTLLFVGAEWLVRGSASLAARLRISPLLIGLTVVAYGTSTPELVVSLKAGWLGNDGIAVGNVVGSNICNLGLILALACLIRPLSVQLQLLRFDVPLLLSASALAVALLWDGEVTRIEGGVLVAGIVAYTIFNMFQARQVVTPEVSDEFAAGVPDGGGTLLGQIGLIVAGLALLMAGGHLLVEGAVDLARFQGVSEAVIGLTIVAVGTSCPELAATLVAAWRRQSDIAIGNVIGSNLYNLLGILGTAAIVSPLRMGGVDHGDLLVMLGMTLFLIPLMRTGFVLQRGEGVLMLAAYVGYIGWRWPH